MPELSTIAPLKIGVNTTIYVATNGSDTRTLAEAQNVSTPLATPQKAMELLGSYYIDPKYYVTIQLGSGVFPMTSTIVLNHPCMNSIHIKGTTSVGADAMTTGNTTTLDYTGYNVNAFSIANNACGNWGIKDLYIKGGAGSGSKNGSQGINIGQFASLYCQNVRVEFWNFALYVTNVSNSMCIGCALCNDDYGVRATMDSMVYYGGSGAAIRNCTYPFEVQLGTTGYLAIATALSGNGSVSPAFNTTGNYNSYLGYW